MEAGEFKGRIGRYHWESEPYWPPVRRAPKGAPNVMVVLLDDVGFAQLGCFGSDLSTPTFDRLASGGLRYTNFHTTALCSPTRATVLTGRNHHRCGVGRIIDLATGFPGYDARIPRSCGMLPAMLTPEGFAAWAVGKWHLTPEDETNMAARRDRWPLGRGFERFYGFFGGETHQFAPVLASDNHLVDPPGRIEDGYHLTEDLADQAIRLVDDLRHVDPEKPFFLYFATGACHSPHQAPPEWIERYAGAFDAGWDVWRDETFARQRETGIVPAHTAMSPRPEWVTAWDDLSSDTRRLYARYMEAFAGFLSHTDHQVGRIVDHLAAIGELDNTLVLVMSDNGASSEGGPVGSTNDLRTWNAIPHTVEDALARIDEIGGPRMHNNYPWGWTVAGNTPFRRWKREVHEGGVADPLIVHWPAGIAEAGGIRRQYVHSIDVAATILDVVGVEPPAEIAGVAQDPLDGVSFASTFDAADAPEVRTTQYYEMLGCRAIYHEGWKAVVYHPIHVEEPGLDKVGWELYDLTRDPAECHDLAAEEPERLEAMVALWWSEAERNHVLPLDNRSFSEFVLGRPEQVPHRNRYVYRPNTSMVDEAVAVNVRNRPHDVTARVVIPDGGAEGVLIAQGSLLGGWCLYVLDNRLVYVHNLSGKEQHRVASDTAVPPGERTLTARYGRDPDDPKRLDLLVDGAIVGSGQIPQFTWSRFSLTDAGLTCGWALQPAVSDDFVAPFPFTGVLHDVVVEVEGDPVIDADAEAEAAITAQ
ncbi:MAG TPA: arylsulfatase [Acidimicrobiia bacterium]|nr:arylsulfatase [Acidimicrobiia bacterium]